MAIPETFYVATSETDGIPAQYEWYKDLDSAKSDAVDCAENDAETYVVYEVTVRPLFGTKLTVELEKM